MKLKEPNYQTDIYNECTNGKSDCICKSCRNYMSKSKMSMQPQMNKMELCLKFSELDRLCLIEMMLMSQIISFTFIVGKTTGPQHGRKEHFV